MKNLLIALLFVVFSLSLGAQDRNNYNDNRCEQNLLALITHFYQTDLQQMQFKGDEARFLLERFQQDRLNAAFVITIERFCDTGVRMEVLTLNVSFSKERCPNEDMMLKDAKLEYTDVDSTKRMFVFKSKTVLCPSAFTDRVELTDREFTARKEFETYYARTRDELGKALGITIYDYNPR